MTAIGPRSTRPRLAPVGILAAVVVAAVGLGTATPVPARVTAPIAGQVDPCQRASWLAGTTEMCGGVLVYRDYVMDDYGAADPLDPTNQTDLLGSLSATAGDARYPDPSRAGTADLVDLSVRIDGPDLVAVFQLNALYEPDSTIAALAIDTDADQATGGGEWAGLGIASDGWDVLETVITGDTTTNTMTLRMPVPEGDRWRLQAVTAKADGTVMNVAFRGIDEEVGLGGSTWWEGRQAAVLATGDITEFGAEVAVADLVDQVTREADHTAPGLHLRVFTSEFTIGTGEGYSYEPEFGRHGDTGATCEQEFASFGRYQPYAVYVPDGTGPHGMQAYLHGCNANHASQIDGEGFQTQFGDEAGRVIVAPLGRGPVGYYSDISEADVFEAFADAATTYRLDPEQWFLSGYSMGGYGTLRLASLYPHLWAGITNWVGFTGDVFNNPAGPSPTSSPSGGIGNAIDFVGNLYWVPSEHLYAGADELVHVTSAAAMAQQLAEVGVDHAFYLHPVADHLTFVLLDEWGKEASASQGRTVVADPPRVVYRTDASLAFPEYGIVHDEAYWVSDIVAVGDGYSDIDLTTHACGGALPVREAGNDAGAEPVPWVADTLRTVGTEPLAPGDRLTGTIVNVSSLTIDVSATCFDNRAVEYALDTDGPVTLAFSDGRTLTLDAAGHHTGVLPVGRRPPAAPPSTPPRSTGGSLPATGGAPILVAAAAMAGIGLLVRRRLSRW